MQMLPESHTDFVVSVVATDPLLVVALSLLAVAAVAAFTVLLRRLRRRSGTR